jgi:tetratricopeptide (TPR) repeat protein
LLPEEHLERAMAAKSPAGRAKWAAHGLAHPGEIDPTTHAMLLRQMYRARYAQGHFAEAYDLATEALELDVLPDVIHQDAARAKQALGDVDGAVGHLRLAARLAPASRRAFHWWTIGSVLFIAERHEEAIAALERAARWGTTDKPLYQGHLALAKCGAGREVRGLGSLIDRLAACPAGQGYGRFVLGQLAYQKKRYAEARRYLEAFVDRTTSSHRPMQIALAGELAKARALLADIESAG